MRERASPAPRSGSVLGLDVGCSPRRRSSAICRLDWDGESVSWHIARFRAVEPERSGIIAAVAGGRPALAAALDGPLRAGFDEIGRYRMAERMLTRRLGPLIGKPGQSGVPVGRLLNAQANLCARAVLAVADLASARHDVAIDAKAVAEAFPNSFLGLMLDAPEKVPVRRSNRSDRYFVQLTRDGTLLRLLEHCLPGRRPAVDLATITNHDDRAAFVCALTALGLVAGAFVAVGDGDGWIVLPPAPFIRPRRWALLAANSAESPDALHVAGGVPHGPV